MSPPPSKWADRPASAAAPCTDDALAVELEGAGEGDELVGDGGQPGLGGHHPLDAVRLASRSIDAASSGSWATQMWLTGSVRRTSVSVAVPRSSWRATSSSRPARGEGGQAHRARTVPADAGDRSATASRSEVRTAPARGSLLATRVATVSGVGTNDTGRLPGGVDGQRQAGQLGVVRPAAADELGAAIRDFLGGQAPH